MTVRRQHRRVDLTSDPRFNSNAFDAAALFGSQSTVTAQVFDTTGLVAGMFDYLGLEELIDTYIGKEGSRVKVNYGAVTKSLVMQLLNVPYQALSGTVEFYKRRPLCALINQDIMPEDLNRHVLSRYLDEVYDLGAEKRKKKKERLYYPKDLAIRDITTAYEELLKDSFDLNKQVKSWDMKTLSQDFDFEKYRVFTYAK